MKSLAIALALAATVLTMASSPARAADAHQHHGHDASAASLKLDNGRKWGTDEALRRGMTAVHQAVHGAPAPLHKGTAKPEAYAEVGNRIEAEIGRIVKECKLPPAADAQLHLVIADMVAGADALKAAKDGKAGRAGLIKVNGALTAYGKHFDHPGWK